MNNTYLPLKLGEIQKMAMNNPDLIQQFSSLYISNLEDIKGQIPKFILEKNLDSLRSVYHRNLPALTIIDAKSLINEMDTAKKLLSEGTTNTSTLQEKAEGIKALCMHMIAEINTYQSSFIPQNKTSAA